MSTTPSSTPSALPNRTRGHGRAASGDERRRVAVPRRSTKGPLEDTIDDPLSSSTHSSIPAASPRRVLSPTPSNTTTTASPISPDQETKLSDLPAKDLSFLLDASAYHVLPTHNVPPPFLNAPSLPSVSNPIPQLLKTGHYRIAAIAAARNLAASTSPTDAPTIFNLLYTRLACLCLINEHALAAAESKLLGDLNSAFYRHPLTSAHLVPWELRMLAVRLAALGYGEWRKGIMGYYELAREARENTINAENEEERALWKSRLRECGIRVANVLVEMGELEGAGHHLSSLGQSQEAGQKDNVISIMEILVWIRVGDLGAAKSCLSSLSTEPNLIPDTLSALIAIADSDYSTATSTFQSLHDSYPDDAMITQNLAVCLLYNGRIAESRKLLEELTEKCEPFHSLIFNLCTSYELCTERNRDRKMELAAKMAGRTRQGGEVGWEIGSADFKL